LTGSVQRLIVTGGFIDTTLTFGDYRARFDAWDRGSAGQTWRLETGITSSALGPGQPFYPSVVTLPAAVNIATERAQIDAAWARRRAATDANPATPPGSPAWRAALLQIQPLPPPLSRLFSAASLGGLELATDYPIREGTRLMSSLTVLTALRPIFEQVCGTIRELGWNDLLYLTAGAAAFRGNTSRPQVLSEHGFGAAVDLNHQENPRGAGVTGSMDPRIVALFEAFLFRWGRCFGTPDPMHFEYCGANC
jgi:hypothetical protein